MASSGDTSKGGGPSEFLKGVIGRPVVVKLNSGVDYRGILACLDGYMNIAMEQTEEYVNGQLKAKYGDAFIRGNNGAYVQPCRAREPGPRSRAGCDSPCACRGRAVLYISTQKKKPT